MSLVMTPESVSFMQTKKGATNVDAGPVIKGTVNEADHVGTAKAQRGENTRPELSGDSALDHVLERVMFTVAQETWGHRGPKSMACGPAVQARFEQTRRHPWGNHACDSTEIMFPLASQPCCDLRRNLEMANPSGT